MPPVIRISDGAWESLKTWATPLEDNPDDALKKALHMADEHRRCAPTIGSDDNGRHPESKAPPASKDERMLEVRPTVEDALRPARRRRLRKGQKVTNRVFEVPILEVLHSHGGSAPMREVLKGVEQKIGHLFGPADYEILPSGREVRWWNTAQWARNTLVHKRGLMKSDSHHGIWELTASGVAEVERHLGQQAKSQ